VTRIHGSETNVIGLPLDETVDLLGEAAQRFGDAAAPDGEPTNLDGEAAEPDGEPTNLDGEPAEPDNDSADLDGESKSGESA
jgi:hypothetical protein